MITLTNRVPSGYEQLAEQALLVRWIGRRDDVTNEVIGAYPQFIVPDDLTAPRAGVVLVVHLARLFTLQPALAYANFSVGNLDDLDRHVQLTFGEDTWRHLIKTFTNRPLGNDNAQFLASQLTSVLKFNFPEQASSIYCDKSRIHRERPFKQLTKLVAERRCNSLASLAWLIGGHYLEAQNRL